MRSLIIASALCVSACASSFSSYVGPIDPLIAPQVAAGMAAFVQARIKPADGTVRIDQPDDDQTVGPALASDLRDSGFVIANGSTKHCIRYEAAKLGDDVMVRVSVDGVDAARLYHTRPTGLVALGPFSVTEIGQ